MRFSRITAVVSLVLMCAVASAHAARRVALVIGNDRYVHLPDHEQLRKAADDARAVGGALKAIGFEVLSGENLGRQAMIDKLGETAQQLSAGDTVLFFFAGHGVAIDGANFILPADIPDVEKNQATRLKGAAIAEEYVTTELTAAGARVAVVILDACRDNPFGAATRGVGADRGLQPRDPPSGVFTLYSAGRGQAALDRLSDDDHNPNSVFTRVLVPALTRPGVDLAGLAIGVREEVARIAQAAGYTQRPAYYDETIGGQVFLAGLPPGKPAGGDDVAPAVAVPPPGPPADEIAWDHVKDTADAERLRQFITDHPASPRRHEAEERLRQAALRDSHDAVAPDAPPAPQPAPQAGAGFPDACRLMVRADLEALFPGMPIGTARPMLSPVYQGPQYTSSCSYDLRLPSPTTRTDVGHIVSLTIIRCDACYVTNRSGGAAAFADLRAGQERLAASLAPGDASRRMQVEPLSDVGDQALEVTSYDEKVYVRKDDLIFFVSGPVYSDQTRADAVALARQAAKRWRGGAGMVEAATAITANTSVEVPPDTREVTTASADKWPDACALLPPEDVRAVFGDMTVGPQQKSMGKLTFASRVDRVEALPHPIRCSYVANKLTTVDGRRQTITNTIEVVVNDVSTTVDVAKRHYRTAAKITGADTPIPGLGDDASIDSTNNVYIRKGVMTITVRVLGDARDQALYADARRRVNEIARLVAARQP